MIHLKLPFNETRRLPFYLAIEEWAARRLPAEEYFFSWRVWPTVICGRNQEMDKEVDMAYCRKNGIDVVRRKSGGGCVYADMDNFMFSYICPGDEVTTTFAHYTTMIALALQELNLNAAATGRNDILISGKKVSGNAFYHLPGRCIAHGTMLYSFNPDVLGKAITPSRAKLESKSVKSVQSRVTSLSAEGIALSPEEFERFMISRLCDRELLLTADNVREIEELEKGYYAPEFLNRKGEDTVSSDFSDRIVRKGRIDGIGELEVGIFTGSDNRIERITITGDFFLTGNPESEIFSHLTGIPFDRESIETALAATDPGKAIPGLTRAHLLALLFP